LGSLRKIVEDTKSLEHAVRFSQMIRNMKKVTFSYLFDFNCHQLIDSPEENVEELLVLKSSLSGHNAETAESLKKLETLKKLAIPLFEDLHKRILV
jgi:hypothetical protein